LQPTLHSFYEITPDRILAAVEFAGFSCTGRFFQLNSMENRVYEVEIEPTGDSPFKTPSDRFKIVKFYRPGRWTLEQLQEEHQFLLDLVADEIPVVAPLILKNERTIAVDEGSSIFFAVFPKMGGRAPDEIALDQADWIGRLLARIHNVGAARPARHRLKMGVEAFGFTNLQYLEDNDVLPIDLKDQYYDVAQEICDIVHPWLQGTESIRIHGDCHLGNLLWNSQGPFWVDFDDMMVGPPAQDVWLLLSGRDEHARKQLHKLLAGYETLRPFDRSSLRLIEALRALRYIHYATWIAKRWKDPFFPRAFPHFGTSDYWQRQLFDLKEQLSQMNKSMRFAPDEWPYEDFDQDEN